MQGDLATFLATEKKVTQKRLRNFLESEWDSYQELPFDGMLQEITDYLLAGGKFARPTLVRLGYEIAGGKSHAGDVVLGSAAMEVFHRFILCHDDIIDQDQIRHGQPTLEAVYLERLKQLNPPHPVQMYDKGMAMVAGDVMHSLSQEMVRSAGFGDSISASVLDGFHRCLMSTAAGWLLETELKQMAIEDVAEIKILEAMRLVSGHYSVLWPLKIGQLFAGLTLDECMSEIETFGENIGIAFQIQDDYLGMFGETEKMGKPIGSDYREGKKTLLLRFTYDQVDEKGKQFLEQNLGTDDQSAIIQVQQMMQDSGAVAMAQQKAQTYVQQALDAVAGLDSVSVRRLQQLGQYLESREE